MPTLQELMDKIQELDKTADYKSMRELLTDDVLVANNDAGLYRCKAMVCNLSQDIANAYKYAQEAIRLAPDNVYGYLQRGISFFYAGDYKNAVADFNTVLNTDKQNLEAFFQRGNALYQLQQYEKAIDDYTSALEFDAGKNTSLIYYDRGLAKNKLAEYESAIKDFDEAIALAKPDEYYQAYCDKGVAHLMLREYEKALQDFEDCQAIKSTYALAFYNRGFLYHQQKKYPEAIKEYTLAIENATLPIEKFVIPVAYNNRGNVYIINEEYDKAFIDFNNALDLDSSMGEAYLNRGIIFQQRQDYAKAKEDFASAFAILQPNEAVNKAYLNFLEEQIKLCDERLIETDRLLQTKASEEDKKAFTDTEKKLDELIDCVSKSARSPVKAVVHYTKLLVAGIYVNAATSRMNYSNAIYMNDPNEGKILLDYFNNTDINNAFGNGEKLSELSVYLGSFLPADDAEMQTAHNDELVMWRTYGRDENGNEACGCSIIIDSRFFKRPISIDKPLTGENADVLCNVIYVRDMGKAKKILTDEDSGIEGAISEFKNQLLNLIKLKSNYDPLDEFSEMIDKLVYKKYFKIAFLFKSADYEYEHEVRVMKYVPRNSDTIKCYPIENIGKPGRLYVESVNPVFYFMQKIYLGPKVPDGPYWSLYLDYRIKQRQNEYKLNKTPEYVSVSSDIQVLKSQKKFV